METFDISRFDPTSSGPMGVSIRFHNHLEEDKLKSAEEGRPIYRETVFIEKAILGTNDVIDRPANKSDMNQYAAQYAKFMKSQDGKGEVEGTPLSEFPGMGRTRIAELNALNIYTLEQFIGLNDSAISRCGSGTRKEIEKIKTWIAAAKDTSVVSTTVEELVELRAQLASAKDEIEELRLSLKERRNKDKDGRN